MKKGILGTICLEEFVFLVTSNLLDDKNKGTMKMDNCF